MAEDLAAGTDRPPVNGRWAFSIGALWGLLTPVVHIAMMRGDLPAPSLDLLGVLRVAVDLPFIVAIGLETAIGRSSPSLPEVSAVAMAVGAFAVWGVWRIAVLVRRRFRRW